MKWADENWMPPALQSIPPFAELKKLGAGPFVGFGCETKEGLANWICPIEFETLRRYGFRLVSMEVDKVHWRDEFNCFFSRSKPLKAGTRRERFNFRPNDELKKHA